MQTITLDKRKVFTGIGFLGMFIVGLVLGLGIGFHSEHRFGKSAMGMRSGYRTMHQGVWNGGPSSSVPGISGQQGVPVTSTGTPVSQ
jgi:hypothetical protein